MMAWLAEVPGSGVAQERVSKAMSFPLGMASPLWLTFGAAASAGVAWWWMTRLTRPANLEAAFATAPVIAALEAAPVIILAEPEPELEAEPEPELELAQVAEAVPAAAVVEAAPEPVAAESPPAPAPVVLEPDDLTKIVGIGPKLAASLAARGVARFADLAAWTEADLAKADAELSLKGRAVRDAWVSQAKRLAKHA